MHGAVRIGLFLLAASCAMGARAGQGFNGQWKIDLRSAVERRQMVECGFATFELSQSQDRVTGIHRYATANCGRLNEGGAVTGVVVGKKAVLVVTSGRTGAIVLGTAELVAGDLHWRALEEVRRGEPAEDAGLVLTQGILKRVKE